MITIFSKFFQTLGQFFAKFLGEYIFYSIRLLVRIHSARYRGGGHHRPDRGHDLLRQHVHHRGEADEVDDQALRLILSQFALLPIPCEDTFSLFFIYAYVIYFCFLIYFSLKKFY
jgi:hypothetical protein